MVAKSLRIAAAFFGSLIIGFAAAPARPNILVVTIDNLGYADFGCFGDPLVNTPNGNTRRAH